MQAGVYVSSPVIQASGKGVWIQVSGKTLVWVTGDPHPTKINVTQYSFK